MSSVIQNKIQSPLSTLIVSKAQILATADYNLTASRYRVTEDFSNAKWEMVELGFVLDYEQPTNYIVDTEDYNVEYRTPVLTAGKTFVLGYTNETSGIFEDVPVIIFDDFTTAIKFVDFPFKVKSSAMKILKAKKDIADIKFVYYCMSQISFSADQHKRYWISEYSRIRIPLPPLHIQEEIVREIEGYQAIIDGAKKVIENWKPKIDIDPEWETDSLNNIFELSSGKFLPKSEMKDGSYPVYGGNGVSGYHDEYFINNPTLTFGRVGEYCGAIHITKAKCWISDNTLYVTKYKREISQEYLAIYLKGSNLNQFAKKGGQPSISQSTILSLDIKVPTISIQEQIIEKIDDERKLVEGNKKLVEIYEGKIKEVIQKVWR